MTISALFVEREGVYSGFGDIELWDEIRDARCYRGPYPVVAHPPCQRWGKFWSGGPSAPGRHEKGDDSGCFASALKSVRAHGGVLEHPANSHAWDAFDMRCPERYAGWQVSDRGWTCYVEQGHYGHFSQKPTWLYAVGCSLPALRWGPSPRRLPPQWYIDKHGYEKARRVGVCALIGGKDKTKIRERTPRAFASLLVIMARSAA